MQLSNREIIAIAVTRPRTFEGILRGFTFCDRAELAIIESMRLVGPQEDYRQWIDHVTDMAKALDPLTDWATWWRETIATQERLLSRIAELRATMR